MNVWQKIVKNDVKNKTCIQCCSFPLFCFIFVYAWCQVFCSLAGGCCPRCWSSSICFVMRVDRCHVWSLGFTVSHKLKASFKCRIWVAIKPNNNNNNNKWLGKRSWGTKSDSLTQSWDVLFEMSSFVEISVTHLSAHSEPFEWKQAEHFSIARFS